MPAVSLSTTGYILCVKEIMLYAVHCGCVVLTVLKVYCVHNADI